MLVQFVNNWMRKFLRQQNRTRPTASSNLAVLGIFSSNYLQIGQHVVLLRLSIIVRGARGQFDRKSGSVSIS